MQAPPRAPAVRADQPAQRLPGTDPCTGAHGRGEWLVLRPDAVGVCEDDHTAAGHDAGEGDLAGTGRPDDTVGADPQIDTEVPGPVARGGWGEPPQDVQRPVQRRAVGHRRGAETECERRGRARRRARSAARGRAREEGRQKGEREDGGGEPVRPHRPIIRRFGRSWWGLWTDRPAVHRPRDRSFSRCPPAP